MTLDLRLARSALCRHICRMLEQADLTPDERGELLQLLRDTIAGDPYPLSRRIRNLKSMLGKLDPQPEPVVEPLPPPRRWVNSTIGRKGRARR